MGFKVIEVGIPIESPYATSY